MKHSYQKARKMSITKFPLSEMVEHTVARFIFNRRENILAEMSQVELFFEKSFKNSSKLFNSRLGFFSHRLSKESPISLHCMSGLITQ